MLRIPKYQTFLVCLMGSLGGIYIWKPSYDEYYKLKQQNENFANKDIS
jgi:hypothetical protein